MGRKIIYVLAAAGLFYLAVLYRSRGLLLVCGAAVLLPLFFLCVLSYVKRRLEFDLFCSSYPQESTGNYRVGIRVWNPGNLYLARIKVKIKMQNMATGRCQWVRAAGKIPARSKTELVGNIKDPEFGLWRAECRFVRCYEWMNLLYLSRKIQAQKQVMIFPDVYDTNVTIGMRTRFFWADGEQYHPKVSGDDPSETFQLREYRNGDRLNQIHWKLSIKNDTLTVAERSMPIGCNVVFFLDGAPDSGRKQDARSYWEVVNTISQELVRQECPYYLVWKDKKQKMPVRRAVRTVEDLSQFWNEISVGRMEKGVDKDVYAREFSGDAYASWIRLNDSLELSCNGKVLAKIQPKQARQQMAELEMVL